MESRLVGIDSIGPIYETEPYYYIVNQKYNFSDFVILETSRDAFIKKFGFPDGQQRNADTEKEPERKRFPPR